MHTSLPAGVLAVLLCTWWEKLVRQVEMRCVRNGIIGAEIVKQMVNSCKVPHTTQKETHTFVSV